MKSHRQILATVNKLSSNCRSIIGKETVEVDYGLKILIELLNHIDGLATIESCRGHKLDVGGSMIWIELVYVKKNILKITKDIYGCIKYYCGDMGSSVSIDYDNSTLQINVPSINLRFSKKYLTNIIDSLKNKFKDGK